MQIQTFAQYLQYTHPGDRGCRGVGGTTLAKKEMQQPKASNQVAWIRVRDAIPHGERTRPDKNVAPQFEGTLTEEVGSKAAAQYWIGT